MKPGLAPSLRLAAAVLGGSFVFSTHRVGAADQPDPAPLSPARVEWGAVTFYSENDFYFAGTDRRYTNGFKASVLARDLRQFDQPGVPAAVRWLSSNLGNLIPAHETPQLALSIGQNIYTPEDIHTPTPDPNDRPYAAWLYTGVAFQARRPGKVALLDTFAAEIGVIGPWALGRELQNGWHDVFDIRPAEGWSNQLHNEVGINLSLERKWRHRLHDEPGWNADVVPHVGASLGNVFTHLNAGLAARWGYHLPDDFGTDLIRPSGRAAAALRPGFNVHVFALVDARLVGRDITLDGNTWRDSPSVPREYLVGDLAFGLSAGVRRWQLTYTQAYRTKEFEGQSDAQVFGSLSLAYYF